jgi:hypothetical protein
LLILDVGKVFVVTTSVPNYNSFWLLAFLDIYILLYIQMYTMVRYIEKLCIEK